MYVMDTLLLVIMVLVLIAIVCGIIARFSGPSRRKRRLEFFSSASFGIGLCLGGIYNYLDIHFSTRHQVEGMISAAIVTAGKGAHTDFNLAASDGVLYDLNLDDTDQRFRRGEHVVLIFRSPRNLVVWAQLTAPTGANDGTYHSIDGAWPYILFAAGLSFVIFAIRARARNLGDFG